MTDRIESALEDVDPAKRAFLRKVVVTSAFAAPVVASFAIDGMVMSKALAQPNKDGPGGVGNSEPPSIPDSIVD